MFEQPDWRETLAAAKRGEESAGRKVGQLLLHWAGRELGRRKERDAEDIAGEFALRLARDRFGRLPELEPRRFEAYLREALKNVAANWRRSWQKCHGRVICCCELEIEEGEADGADLDRFAGSAEDPVAVVLRAAESEALQAQAARLSPRRRQIFALLFEEGLSEGEVAKRLGMSARTVAWHVCWLRRQLQRWRDEEWG